MTHMVLTDLPFELLKTILILVAISSDGAADVARAISTCKTFMNLAKDSHVLKAVNFDKVTLSGRWKLFHHINGLFSRCARSGNETAQYMLAKTVLLGSSRLWIKMWENDILQSSFDRLSQFALSEKRSILDSLRTSSSSDQAYICNASRGHLHHSTLVRSFLSRCSSDDIILMHSHLEDYCDYFVGFRATSDSGILDSIERMCMLYEILEASKEKAKEIFGVEEAESTSGEILLVPVVEPEEAGSGGFGIAMVSLLPPRDKAFELLRVKAIADFDRLFPPPKVLCDQEEHALASE